MDHKETPRGWFFGLFYGWKHRVLIVVARCIDHNGDNRTTVNAIRHNLVLFFVVAVVCGGSGGW